MAKDNQKGVDEEVKLTNKEPKRPRPSLLVIDVNRKVNRQNPFSSQKHQEPSPSSAPLEMGEDSISSVEGAVTTPGQETIRLLVCGQWVAKAVVWVQELEVEMSWFLENLWL